jgi:hypothetical protein
MIVNFVFEEIFPEDDVYFTLFRQYMPYFASFYLQLETRHVYLI